MYISIDMGRSTTRIASTLDLKDILKIAKFPTREKLEDQKKSIEDSIKEVSDGSSIKAVVLGFPGIVNEENDTFIKSANYPQIEGLKYNFLLPDDMADVKVFVVNDASLGALGEAYFGSGRGRNAVAYLTLSTGVGGSLVLKHEKKFNLIKSEPGHHVIDKNDSLEDGSGLKGTFESFCSGPFFERRYSTKPDKNADEDSWKVYASNLSVGLLNLIALWNPEIIILGGGVSIHNFKSFYPFLIKELSKQTFFEAPEIKEAYLGDNAGVYGGFVFLKSYNL